MAAYVYIKRPPRQPINVKSIVFSSVFLGSGIFLLGLVVWPILTFELFFSSKASSLVSPLAEEKVLGVGADLTRASNWFPAAAHRITESKITSYSLSIPRLGIKDAGVTIGGENLSKNLIHWGGTALPGDFGTTVIFGHSVLPAFFDPKNYMTIFSTLPTLKVKDEVFIYFDGITYRYQVFEMKVVDPDDLSVLDQKFDDSYISLVTCVPPGTYWKRLIVKARLTEI